MSEKLRAAVFAAALLAAGPVAAEEALRDPTRPYNASVTPAASAPGFDVSAIFVSEQRRVAVVNGRPVTVGARIDGAVVTAIAEDGIKLNYAGRALSARLQSAQIRDSRGKEQWPSERR